VGHQGLSRQLLRPGDRGIVIHRHCECSSQASERASRVESVESHLG
jgi:hypothetical protein